MSLEFWTFVAALLALVATVWFGYKSLQKQNEQLRLARREAERHPALQVSAMNLINATEVSTVVDTVKERKQWLEELERYEEAKTQWEERQNIIREERARNPLAYHSAELFLLGPQDPTLIRHWNDHLLMAQQDYDSPFPNKVLRVTLVNRGKTAALDVSGQLYLDANYLQPLSFPGLDGNVEDKREGTYKVNLHTSEGSRLLPSPTDEDLIFEIAVLTKNPGTTHIRYTFATPQGDNVEGTWPLDIPS